jgi:hypothetical protein
MTRGRPPDEKTGRAWLPSQDTAAALKQPDTAAATASGIAGKRNAEGGRGGVGAAERAVLHRQLHARRLAAARSLRLACGCREPMPHQCRPQRLSLDSAIAAHEHLTALGLTPLFDPDTERDLRLVRLPA